ncbi:regulator of vacualor membrane ATPase [Acrasis kona]|uniref:Regulator of vacualor membrane ATPase n=1 Tax=Acrasis kona TaxID=1008807 RepID=A0AAW2ZK10_9EUKA
MSDKEAVIRFREYNFDQDPKWKELVENLSIFDEPGSYAYENKLYRQKKKYYHSKVEPILSILGDDDYKQHVTYKKGEENSQTNTDDAPPQNNPSTESSPPSQTQQIQGGVVHKYFRRFYKSLTTATLLNLSAFTSSILSVLLMLFSTGLSRSFYYLSLFSLAFLYLGTYFANKGFSLESLKLLCSDVFGLYAAIILTFLTTPQSITFSLLITLWAFSPLPSLVQRFMNRNNIQNANIQSLVNKAATYSPAVPMAAAKLELSWDSFQAIDNL